ncbi:hypothetical protein F1721_32830 [Saccharopolyspora hirsuta]|uniref:Uncharacterized protein n=1 Tax=Saccharopolyspora hirsuta TaxID=1837 RepID=A0A5M7BD44_SACHI|nr:hypothetical protein [Saccharopolyspora hirsuta]KAA5825424.1 hypothetical protein F1721_32830 [Saccharopolyspora hirsuta]
MTTILIALAMFYILIKLPFWVLGSIRGGKRSFVGSLVKGFLAYKTYGLLRSGVSPRRPAKAKPTADPYAKTSMAADGQYMLPLAGLKRGRIRTPSPPLGKTPPKPTPPKRRVGRQGALFTPDGTPASSALPPELGPDAMRVNPNPGEQHMLPIYARHDPSATPRPRLHDDTTPRQPRPQPRQPGLFTRTGRAAPHARPPKPGNPGALPTHVAPGEQMRLPLVGPFTTQARPTPAPHPVKAEAGEAPRVTGQRPLLRPNGEINPAARPPRPRRSPARPSAPAAYKGIRPDRTGQYALPLNLPKPSRRHRPSTPTPPSTPAPAPVRDGNQLELPLNLPGETTSSTGGDRS